MTSRPAPKRRLTPELFGTLLLVLVYIVWLLSLPAWPSQDGPAHLYYVHVLGELFSAHSTVYRSYYTIKHLLPPYALYYYALLALSKLAPLLLADRLIVCIYLLLFVFGFRYLAQAIGPAADRSTLLAVLLALNWSAGIGFLNYCLSLALVFWAMGLWLRFSEKIAPRVAFLLLVAAITLTHPVPLLILLTFCGVDWLQRSLLRGKTSSPTSRRSPLALDLTILLLSACALFYVRHFATAHPLSQAQSIPRPYLSQTAHHVLAVLQLHSISLIFGHSLPILIYRFGQLMTIVIGLVLAIAQRRRNRAAGVWKASDTWLVYSVALFVLIPLLPSDISDAFYFTERLSILIWLAPLLAASGWQPRARSISLPAILLFVAITNVCLLWQADRLLRPVAAVMAAVDHAPRTHTGELGLVLDDSRPGRQGKAGPSWNPYYWAGAHVLRHDDAVLDNSPWLDSAIIPLGALPTLPVAATSTGDSASPYELSLRLYRFPAARQATLAPVDFVLITQPGRPAPSALDPLLGLPSNARNWNCRLIATWYQICTPGVRR